MVMQTPAAVCINSKNVFVCFDFDGKWHFGLKSRSAAILRYRLERKGGGICEVENCGLSL